jgi:hypothetical protein
MRRGVLVLLLAVTLPFLPASHHVASAEEGSPVAPTNVGPRLRPPLGMLRPVDEDRAVAPSPMPRSAGRELIVLVGGYQSCACPDDGTFDALRDRLAGNDRFDVVRFGADPRFPYDTYGPVQPSAINLRDQIRVLSPQYDGVHVVTHSMGGVVADRAFANGLSYTDGVVSYVSWSAPHSGSDAARALLIAGELSGSVNGPFRESLLWLRKDIESPAMRDLARATPVPPPPGVVRLDLRVASDILVTARDAEDPGVPSRTLIGPLEGHGGILADPVALDLTIRTIRDRRVPPEERHPMVVIAAEQQSEQVGMWVLGSICVLAFLACASAALQRPLRLPYVPALQNLLPRVPRRPCP